MATIEELKETIEDIKLDMASEKMYDVDKKITVTNRSAKELSYALGLAQAELTRKTNGPTRTRFKRAGFED